MKKVMITGADSYIGTALENWLINSGEEYQVDTVDVRENGWKEVTFSDVDTVFHVAAIVHQKEDELTKTLYLKVNRDLPIEIAKKAKADGVKQFIFLSSMSVYGDVSGEINELTELKPKSFYGVSKLQAEEQLLKMQNDTFKIVILRPPIVYGKGCKGNYPRLSGLARKTPIFPNVKNKRSMLFIEYLCEFVKLMIDNEEQGIFFPQNREYVNSSELVKKIAKTHGHHILVTTILSPAVWLGCHISGKIGVLFEKVFGDCYYALELSEYKYNYRLCDFDETIKKSECQ